MKVRSVSSKVKDMETIHGGVFEQGREGSKDLCHGNELWNPAALARRSRVSHGRSVRVPATLPTTRSLKSSIILTVVCHLHELQISQAAHCYGEPARYENGRVSLVLSGVDVEPRLPVGVVPTISDQTQADGCKLPD